MPITIAYVLLFYLYSRVMFSILWQEMFYECRSLASSVAKIQKLLNVTD